MTEAFETVAAAAFERVKEQRRGEIKVKVLTGSKGQEVNTPPLDASSSCFASSLVPFLFLTLVLTFRSPGSLPLDLRSPGQPLRSTQRNFV